MENVLCDLDSVPEPDDKSDDETGYRETKYIFYVRTYANIECNW